MMLKRFGIVFGVVAVVEVCHGSLTVAAPPEPKLDPPTPKVASQTPEMAGPARPPVDVVLDRFAEEGRGIKILVADLEEISVDELAGEVRKRRGKVLLDRSQSPGLVRIEIHAAGTSRIEEEYIFDGQTFWKVNYRSKQIQGFKQSGAQTPDIFELGRGPFPLPIGQPRDKVQRLFATELRSAPDADPVVVSLRPRARPGSDDDFARQYEEFVFTAAKGTGVPSQVVTRDKASRQKTIKLTEVVTNKAEAIGAGAFDKPDIHAAKFRRFAVDIR